MTPIHDIMRERLLRKAGLGEVVKPKFTLDGLERSEWSPTFERLMRNRLIMGALRYGLLHDPNKRRWDRVGSIRKRLEGYAATGNTEFLVDIANLCLLEFEEGVHPLKHFRGVDRDEGEKGVPHA